MAGLGLAGVIAATVVIGMAPDGDPKGIGETVALFGIAWGGFALAAGGVGLARSLRMGWLLRSQEWVTRRAAYRIAPFGANGQPALLVKADEHGEEAVCSIPAVVTRYRQLEQGQDIELLVVGNPRRWAVVSPPDLHILLAVKRPWVPLWGRRLRRYALGS
jgi:hypothetical protein